MIIGLECVCVDRLERDWKICWEDQRARARANANENERIRHFQFIHAFRLISSNSLLLLLLFCNRFYYCIMIFLFGFIDGFYQVTVITQTFVGVVIVAVAIIVVILFVYASINAHVHMYMRTWTIISYFTSFLLIAFVNMNSIWWSNLYVNVKYIHTVVVTLYFFSMATASRRRDFTVYRFFFLSFCLFNTLIYTLSYPIIKSNQNAVFFFYLDTFFFHFIFISFDAFFFSSCCFFGHAVYTINSQNPNHFSLFFFFFLSFIRSNFSFGNCCLFVYFFFYKWKYIHPNCESKVINSLDTYKSY